MFKRKPRATPNNNQSASQPHEKGNYFNYGATYELNEAEEQAELAQKQAEAEFEAEREKKVDAAWMKQHPEIFAKPAVEHSTVLGMQGPPQDIDRLRRERAAEMVRDTTGLAPGERGEWEAVDAMHDTLREMDGKPSIHFNPEQAFGHPDDTHPKQ